MSDDRHAVTTLVFAADPAAPNNPDLPVVIVRAAISRDLPVSEVQATVRRNGWGGAWLYGVFPYHHYHSNAHEALICVGGEADLLLGGEGGERITVRHGDALVLPAGTGHKCLSSSRDFLVCGCYPPGQEDADLKREGDPRDGVAAAVASVTRPQTDPLFGATGPLVEAWGG
ncbi:MAG: cupin domain-containing protein [Thalassobaculaceae bacterium]|nr:cupin domain-containing protein [Thalassobaculaceae bacterium]